MVALTEKGQKVSNLMLVNRDPKVVGDRTDMIKGLVRSWTNADGTTGQAVEQVTMPSSAAKVAGNGITVERDRGLDLETEIAFTELHQPKRVEKGIVNAIAKERAKTEQDLAGTDVTPVANSRLVRQDGGITPDLEIEDKVMGLTLDQVAGPAMAYIREKQKPILILLRQEDVDTTDLIMPSVLRFQERNPRSRAA